MTIPNGWSAWCRAWGLARLGHHLRSRPTRRAGLGIAAAALVLTCWSYLAGAATYDGRAERLAARTPVLTEGEGPRPAFARWLDLSDTHHERQFAVVYVAPLDSDAPPPPGLPRWPTRGEVFLSPGLLSAGDGIAERYGTVAGTIGGDGLADDGEWLAYVRPVSDASFDRHRGGRPTFVTGWGVDPAEYAGGVAPAWFTASHGRPSPVDHLYWLITLAAAVPALALVSVVSRWRVRRLSRALAHLRARGVSRGGQALVQAGEAMVPVAAGALIGVLAAATSTAVDIVLPFVGYQVTASDLAAKRSWLPAVWVGAFAMVVAAAVLAPRRRARVNRHRERRTANLRGYARLVFAMGVAVAAAGMMGGGFMAYAVGTLAGLMALYPLAEPIAAAAEARFRGLVGSVGVATPRHGRMRTRRTAIPTTVRVALAVTIVLFVSAVGIASFVPNERIRAENRAYGQHGPYELAEVRARWDTHELAAFTAAVPDATVLYIAHAGNSTTLVGDCRSLAALGELTSCPTTATPNRAAYAARNAAGIAVFEHTDFVASDTTVHANPAPVPAEHVIGLVVLNHHSTGGIEAVKRAAYATVSMPLVSQPGETWVVGPSAALGLRRWIYLFGAVAVTLVLLAGTLALSHRFQTRIRPSRTVSMVHVALPLAVATLAGAGGAAALGAVLYLITGR
jgi:hypothetical protein